MFANASCLVVGVGVRKMDIWPMLISLLIVFGRGLLLGKLFLVEVHSSVNLDMMGLIMEVALACCVYLRFRCVIVCRGECPWRSWGPGLFHEVLGVLILTEFLMASHRHHSRLPPSSYHLALFSGLCFLTQRYPMSFGLILITAKHLKRS